MAHMIKKANALSASRVITAGAMCSNPGWDELESVRVDQETSEDPLTSIVHLEGEAWRKRRVYVGLQALGGGNTGHGGNEGKHDMDRMESKKAVEVECRHRASDEI